MHGNKPVTQGELGAMHDCTTAEGRPDFTIFTFILPLVAIPIMLFTHATVAYDTFIVPMIKNIIENNMSKNFMLITINVFVVN